MTERMKPPVFRTVGTGWSDAFNAIGSMSGVAGVVYLILLPLAAAQVPLLDAALRDPQAFSFGHELTGIAIGIAQSFLLTPWAIVIHRYVLLGEVAQRYPFYPTHPRFLRFFGYTVAVMVMTAIPRLTFGPWPNLDRVSAVVLGIVGFTLMIVVLIVSVRIVIVFPSIAVDAAGADWRNAMRDSKGNFWRIFCIILLTVIPAGAVNFAVHWAVGKLLSGWPAIVVEALVTAAVSVAAIAALAAIASRLFAALADSLGPPSKLQAPRPATI